MMKFKNIFFLLHILTLGTYAQNHVGSITNGDGGALLNGANSVFVSGNYAYVLSASNALEIVDISDPTEPFHVSNISHGQGGALLNYPKSVYVSGNYAYVTSYNALEIIDVSNPAMPLHSGNITDGQGGALLSNPVSIYISGNYAFIASQDSNALEIIDVSNPAAPIHAGSIVNGTGGASLAMPSDVHVSGNYAYLSCLSNASLEIVDVSNPTVPQHAGSISWPNLSLPNNASSVYVSGNHAFVTCVGKKSLEIVNVSNPLAPLQKSTFPLDFDPIEVFVSENHAYIIGAQNNVLKILDVNNPAIPYIKSSFYNGSQGALLNIPLSVKVSEEHIYIASWGSNALEIIKFLPITISSFHPTSGPKGTIVQINGTNFNANLTKNIVRFGFGGNPALLNSNTTTWIKAIVPNISDGGYVINVSQADQNQIARTPNVSGSWFMVTNPKITSPNTGSYGESINLVTNTGGSTGAVTYSVTNGSGSATVSGSTLILTGVGTVTVTAHIAGDGTYNSITATQIITISKANLSVHRDNVTKTFGSPNPSLTLRYLGFKFSDNSTVLDVLPTVSTNATECSNVGSYPISWSTSGFDDNYTLVYPHSSQSGFLTITKASLLVQANNQSRNFGSANPVLSISYSGFVCGNTIGEIDSPPIASTTANNCSNPGVYSILTSGGSDNNYNFIYQSGSLTVNSIALPPTTASGATTFCSGGSVTLTAPTGSAYLWSSGQTSQSIVVNSSGSYTATVTINACSITSNQITVIVHPLPTPPTIAGGALFCSSPINLTSSSASSYLWSTGATSQSISISSGGIYSVTTTNASGCSATSAPFTVIDKRPSITMTSGVLAPCSEATNAVFAASSGSSYLWSTGQTSQSITASTPADFYVTVNNPQGCSGQFTSGHFIVQTSPFSVSISGAESICTGSIGQLIASINLPGGRVAYDPYRYTYLWSTGETSSSINIYSGGTYTVVITSDNNFGCQASASFTVTESNCNPPDPCLPNEPCINEAKLSDEMMDIGVYPNPVDNELTVTLSQLIENPTDLFVFDPMGKLISKIVFEKGVTNKKISTRQLPAGVYIIKMKTTKGIFTQKVMIVHKQ